MTEVICPLDARGIVAPLLPSLPSAAVASEPATAILPLLSPILRQRVQFLSASSSEPWIRLLSYDAAKAAKLVEIARSTRLDPHPLSGEVEIDWDSAGDGAGGGDVEIRYRRIDIETLQALVLLRDLDLVFRLVYVETDNEGGGSGWRVGEVSIPDVPDAFCSFGGCRSAAEAERSFAQAAGGGGSNAVDSNNGDNGDDGDNDEDDDYWARYDATPARTPAVQRSPTSLPGQPAAAVAVGQEADDAYFAQYDTVQPAMDNHDPDEDVGEPTAAPPPLGLARPTTTVQTLERAADGHSGDDDDDDDDNGRYAGRDIEADERERLANLVHPRPASASSQSSSGGSAAVAKLEHSAGKRERSEFGVKQHISRSMKSLFMLSRASGIDREEFEQLVKTELDMLAMMEDDD